MKDFEKEFKEVETTKKSQKDYLASCVRLTKRAIEDIEKGTNGLTKNKVGAIEQITEGKAVLKFVAKVLEELMNE